MMGMVMRSKAFVSPLAEKTAAKQNTYRGIIRR